MILPRLVTHNAQKIRQETPARAAVATVRRDLYMYIYVIFENIIYIFYVKYNL
jgi:hypothetical protein